MLSVAFIRIVIVRRTFELTLILLLLQKKKIVQPAVTEERLNGGRVEYSCTRTEVSSFKFTLFL